jgi:hypothetical protein
MSTLSGFVDKAEPQAEARSNASFQLRGYILPDRFKP